MSCTRLFDRLTPKILNLRLNQDKFQTFVCYVLLVIVVVPTILYLIIVFDNIKPSGCQGARFTVLSQYSTWEWMNQTFNEFRLSQAVRRKEGKLSGQICYNLILSSNPFVEGSEPVLYQPDYDYWLNAAQAESGDDAWLNTSTACKKMTSIPFGVVTWDFIAKDYPNRTISYTQLEILMNKSIPYDGSNLTNFFIHGHPNVTSGGQLGLMEGILQKKGTIPADYRNVQALEARVYHPSDIDIESLKKMILHGPRFAIATFGFENEMIYINQKQENGSYTADQDWDNNATLAFLYFNESFWMEHPLCVMEKAPWVRSEDLNVAYDFLKFIDNTYYLDDTFVKFGIRPSNQSAYLDPKVFKPEYVNPNFTPATSVTLETADYSSVRTLNYDWQKIKRPIYLQLLIDVSSGLTKTVDKKKNRWFYLKNALSVFGEVLENAAVINITCFSSTVVPCGSETFDANSTALNSTRDDYQRYIENTLSTSSQKQRALFKTLTEVYKDLTATKDYYKTQTWGYYGFALLVISQADNTHYNELANKFIWEFPVPVTTDGVVIHSVLYFDRETSFSGLALQKISKLTEGHFSTATQDLDEVLRDLTYVF